MDGPPTPSSYHIRIPETAFTATITTFLILAVLSALLRTLLRLRYTRSLSTDDYFLLYAVAVLIAAGAVTHGITDLVYLQIYVGLGWTKPAADFIPQMLVFEKRVQAASALAWSSLYATLWWVVLACVVVGAMASIPLAFIVCANFSDDYMHYCSITHQLANERIYLATTTALDIATDLLVISIPCTLLYPVRLPLGRKLALGSMLCLSFFMMIIAIIRTALAPLPENQVVDTSWLIFWEGIEATTAIIMVSLTAFRSLFGQERMRSRERESGKRECGKRERRWWGKSGEGWKPVGSAVAPEVVGSVVGKEVAGTRESSWWGKWGRRGKGWKIVGSAPAPEVVMSVVEKELVRSVADKEKEVVVVAPEAAVVKVAELEGDSGRKWMSATAAELESNRDRRWAMAGTVEMGEAEQIVEVP